MSSVCGWFGQLPMNAEASAALDRMARADRSYRDTCVRSIAIPDAAATALAWTGAAHLCKVADVLVAVEGYVTWTTAELDERAREHGLAATILEAYTQYGSGCLARMQGPFSLAILDPSRRRALLAVDPLGIRSMYFAVDARGLVFGTRAAQVVASHGGSPGLDPQAVFDYLYSHVVPSPRTIYAGISKLEPGECVEWVDGAARRTRYWRLPYRDDGAPPTRELEARVRELLSDSVARSIRDVAVGAFLSGGTDSSTVVGMLARARADPVDTYSIGFAVDGFDELEYARITAAHFRCTAHEHYVTPKEVAATIPTIAAWCDEPFGNASVVAAYACARMAAEDGKRLLLAGDGGDEIFGGNARYAKQATFEAYYALPGWLRMAVVEPLAARLPERTAFVPLRKLKSYVTQARIPLPDRLEAYNFLEREPLEEIFEPDFLGVIDRGAPIRSIRATWNGAASRSPTNRMMHLDLKVTLADNDLRKVNIACELAGLAVAYPLLDRELVEFTGLIPASAKVRGLKLRYLFKNALRDFLPQQTIAKRKHGFGLPFGVWLASDPDLRTIAFDSIASFRKRGFLRRAYLDRLSARHTHEHASYYGVMLWVLMMLEQWLLARGR